MLIDRNYILQRTEELIAEKQKIEHAEKRENDKLYKIKLFFPDWLRSIVFHPFNPFYSIYLQSKEKNNNKNRICLSPFHPLAVDFVKYCFSNDINFETSRYFSKEYELLITDFIDNRLKSVIAGYGNIVLNDEQIESKNRVKKLKSSVKRNGDNYHLNLDNISYYLFDRSFQEHTFIHDYGLRYLPENVIEYIKNKDFLDVGAYIGDTSILLSKKYSPRRIYAFEPVPYNLELLNKIIRLNNIDNISIIEKGVGEKEEDLDIYINEEQTSSCSINSSISIDQEKKYRIKITTIDQECKDKTIGLIKMDIEGAEYNAIKGGLETIKRDKPVLLISLYHTGKDFFEIPPLLQETVPEYQFQFLNIELSNPISEKILVAYPKLS